MEVFFTREIKKYLHAALRILVILIFTGCPTPNDSTPNTVNIAAAEESGFISASDPGDSGVLTLEESSETLTMIYANNSTSITFPTGVDDSGTETLTTRFFMAETEVTNAVMVAVMQWAYDNNKFSSNVTNPNGLDSTMAKQYGTILLVLYDTDCRVDYDGSGTFSTLAYNENKPVTNVTWYGAVVFCNWLTEMRDGNTDNVVYTGIDTPWVDDDTIETVAKTGYRLPSREEWEYTARYRGDSNINIVSGYTNPNFTKGDSASGATENYNSASACRDVAVYSGSSPVPADEVEVKSLGAGSTNLLGLYDMSGNVDEWCSTEPVGMPDDRVGRGANYSNGAGSLRIGTWGSVLPSDGYGFLGFRLCRTAD